MNILRKLGKPPEPQNLLIPGIDWCDLKEKYWEPFISTKTNRQYPLKYMVLQEESKIDD